MQVSVLKENLDTALAIVLRSVANRPQLPILQNILLDGRADGMYISGTDLEIGVTVRVDAKIDVKGKVTVPAKMFGEFIGSIPAGKVELELAKESLKVESGSFKAVFQTISADEFPALIGFEGEGQGIIIEANELVNAAEKVIFSAAKDSMRPVLTGVLLEFGKTKLKMVATDGFRLATHEVGYGGESEMDKLIIPSRAVSEMVKFKEGEVRLKMVKENNQVVIGSGDVVLVAQLLDGNFPDYKKIIPDSFESEIVIAREELLQAVRVSQVFARDNSNVLKWEVKGNKLVMKSESPEMGSNVVEVDVKLEGEGGEITFNGRFLLDLLTTIDSDSVWFGMSGSLAPGSFREEGKSEYLYIVMPINV